MYARALVLVALAATSLQSWAQSPAVRVRSIADVNWSGTDIRVELRGSRAMLTFHEAAGSALVRVEATGAELRRWVDAVEAMRTQRHHVGRDERVEVEALLHSARQTDNVKVQRTTTPSGSRYVLVAQDDSGINFAHLPLTPARLDAFVSYLRAAAESIPPGGQDGGLDFRSGNRSFSCPTPLNDGTLEGTITYIVQFAPGGRYVSGRPLSRDAVLEAAVAQVLSGCRAEPLPPQADQVPQSTTATFRFSVQ